MPASYRTSTYDARPPLRDRLAASGLSLAIIGAIIVALLWVTAAPYIDMGSSDPLATFDVAVPQRAPAASRSTPRPAAPQPRERATPPPPSAERRPPPTPPVPVPLPPIPGLIVLSREDYARSDIAGIRSKPGDGATGKATADAGGGKPVYGPSEAPGGRTLYAADWYREPTRAEIAPFLPPSAAEGWGMIACQTAERFRVENCRELGETPGSGIARGLRRASWQFLVRPPAIDGKPQIGAWVRIRFDLVRGVVP